MYPDIDTKVWGPFMALTSESSFLELMLLLGHYRVHRVPIVDQSDGRIVNFITQRLVLLTESTFFFHDLTRFRSRAPNGHIQFGHEHVVVAQKALWGTRQ